jgi:hypothetical protein
VAFRFRPGGNAPEISGHPTVGGLALAVRLIKDGWLINAPGHPD